MTRHAIETEAGPLRYEAATIDQLQGIASYWPMGLLVASEDPLRYGLVFQQGEDEVHGVKLQPVDVEAEQAQVQHHMSRCLIATAIPHYLQYGHRGVLVPCAYYKEKAEGKAEAGIVIFTGPDAESASGPGEKYRDMYDKDLGAGASSMVYDMVRALGKAAEKTGFPFQIVGVDVRPRLAVGGLVMHFIVEGPRVFLAKDSLVDEEPVWQYAVQAGFTSLPYAPMLPVALPEAPSSGRGR